MKKHMRKVAVFLIVVMAVTVIPVDLKAASNGMYKTADLSHIPKGLIESIKSDKTDTETTGGTHEIPVIKAEDVVAPQSEEGPDSSYNDPTPASPEFNGYAGDEYEFDLEWSETAEQTEEGWGTASLPSSYDMRTKPYASKIAIKNQSETGLCWAFAVTTAAEINYYHKYGAHASAKTLSPLALGYFTYNKVNDPLGLTNGDRNVIADSSKNWKSVGGGNTISANMLSGWVGFVPESKMPFSNRNQSSYNTNLGYKSNDLILRNAYMLNYKDRNQVKQAIMDYGSVTTNMYIHENFNAYLNRYGAYEYPYKDSNHIVTIIGWDDSKQAWLVQNSWGSSWRGYGTSKADGCFYMSYNDKSATSMMAVEVQPQSAYGLNYHYDGTASGASRDMSAGTRVANIYKVNDSDSSTFQVLKAIGLTTETTSYATYNIEIYTGCSAGKPTSGTRVACFTASTKTAGFHTIDLPYIIEIPDGQRYSIVITFNQKNYIATEEPTTTTGYSSIKYVPVISTGQSYWSGSRTGAFNDFAKLSSGCCARIKGFASEYEARVENEDYYRIRHEGSDRVQTSAMVNNNVRALEEVDKWNTTIVAYGLDFPDALAGSYLSKVNGCAPIMLVYKDYENAMVKYLQDTVKYGGKIYILGGTGVISSKFERDLRSKGFNVKRLAGNDRYETNLAVLRETRVTNQELLVCAGNGYADSLSASAVGKPILLVGNSINSSQQKYLNSISSKKAYIIGGTGAVSSNVERELKNRGYTISRFSGNDRYQTSAMVADYFFGTNPKSITLVYGLNYPDGLSGGPLALRYGGPLLLADNNKMNVGYIKDYVFGIKDLVLVNVLGGESLISNSMVRHISK